MENLIAEYNILLTDYQNMENRIIQDMKDHENRMAKKCQKLEAKRSRMDELLKEITDSLIKG